MTQLSRREFFATASMGTAVAGFALAGAARLRAEPLGIPIGSQTYPVRARIAQGEFVAVLKGIYEAGRSASRRGGSSCSRGCQVSVLLSHAVSSFTLAASNALSPLMPPLGLRSEVSARRKRRVSGNSFANVAFEGGVG